jgi:hypothetical protein
MRDDFIQKTKDNLAKRVAFTCSNPKCNIVTIGPNSNSAKTTSIGVAAHITAASKGGPRYESSLTSEQRKSINNGIWLCQSCSKLIDTDVGLYSTKSLNEWKNQAEKIAGERLNKQMATDSMFANSEDFESIKENGFYEKEFSGQKVRYYLQGAFLHVEHEPTPGIIAYYVLDQNGNVVENKFPHELSEYEVIIEPGLILRTRIKKLSNQLSEEIIFMKWGNVAHLIKNNEGLLVSFNIKRGCTISHTEKKIWIKRPEFKK